MTNRLRQLRSECGEMTQAQLAELVGVTRQTINAIEQAKYSPSLEVAFMIAQALGVSIQDSFQLEGDPLEDGQHAAELGQREGEQRARGRGRQKTGRVAGGVPRRV